MSTNSEQDAELRHTYIVAKHTVRKPYDTDIPERDQDINVWIDHHVAAQTAGLRAVAAAAWDEAARTLMGKTGVANLAHLNPFANALILGQESDA